MVGIVTRTWETHPSRLHIPMGSLLSVILGAMLRQHPACIQIIKMRHIELDTRVKFAFTDTLFGLYALDHAYISHVPYSALCSVQHIHAL